MKKSILFLSTIFIVLTFLFSCSDETSIVEETNNVNVEATKNLILASQEMSLIIGEKKTIKIVTGNDSYTVRASNTNIKTGTENGVITIEGIVSGDGVVTVKDSKEKVSKIKVTVEKPAIDDLILDKTDLELVRGNKGTVTITAGSGSYKVESKDIDIAIVELTGTTIEISGNQNGITKIIVTDIMSNKTKEITVVVGIVLKYLKDGVEFAPYLTDRYGPFFDVSLGDIITIQVIGGTGSGQKIASGHHLEFLEFLDVSIERLDKIIQNNSFRVKIIKEIVRHDEIFFDIKDSNGESTEYVTFDPKQEQ